MLYFKMVYSSSFLKHYWFCVQKKQTFRHWYAHAHALIIKNVIFAKIEMVMLILFPSNLQACLNAIILYFGLFV